MNENIRKIGLLILIGVLFAGGYKLAQEINPEGVIVNTFVDDWIPFVDYFVIFYIMYFPLILIPFAAYWKNYRDYKRVALAFLMVILISVASYLVFQTQVARPDVETSGIFGELVLWLYGNDLPVNALPSLHVSLSALTAFFMLVKVRGGGIPIAVLAVLVMLSTMLIKQHSILDAIAGLLLATVVFKLRYRLVKK